jgi:hypothetical protein
MALINIDTACSQSFKEITKPGILGFFGINAECDYPQNEISFVKSPLLAPYMPVGYLAATGAL